MNSFVHKIITCLLLVMFGGNMATAAIGTVASCVTQPCCCRGGIEISQYEPAQAGYSTANGCCSSAANTPCNLNKNYRSDVQAFIIPNVESNPENSNCNIAFVSGEPSFIKIFCENIRTNLSRIVDDPIPIYLQNLTFIC